MKEKKLNQIGNNFVAWKPSVEIRNIIWCYKCKSDTGYTNDDLKRLSRDLNCPKCGKLCIRYLTNQYTPAPLTDPEKPDDYKYTLEPD